jgi:chromosome segregation protein
VEVDKGYERAFEAAARSWLDTVLVATPADALRLVRSALNSGLGAVRMLAPVKHAATLPDMKGLDPLIKHVKADGEAAICLMNIIGNVAVVSDPAAVPEYPSSSVSYVTLNGAVASSAGAFEIWTGESASNPFTLKHKLSECEGRIEELNRTRSALSGEINTLTARIRELASEISDSQKASDTHARTLALKEGEGQVLKKELEQSREKLDTVTFEVDTLLKEGKSGDETKSKIASRIAEIRIRRDAVTREISENTESLHNLENRNSDINSELTDRKVEAASLSQRLDHVKTQYDQVKSSLQELENAVHGRSKGIAVYAESRIKLTAEIEKSTNLLSTLEKSVETSSAKVESLSINRDKQREELTRAEERLSARRNELEETRARKSKLDVRLAEGRMRRQNMLDRASSDYSVTTEDIASEPDPDWEGEKPALETVETMVAELKTKLDAMGPVNLVAIDEYGELEERYAFLTEQEQDLINSKQHLMDLIRKINRTTSDMFKSTFEQANINFDAMFKKLFNGGTAKLVLVNEEDILECGIEIIARPPGKRLQNVSLLSGGERTMTAVALLFAIYMIKPSAFCLLDELDAALDDANVGRFASVLTDFVQQSQFLVITHNKQTIAAASTIYGVTMPDRGVSELVSMKFRDYEDNEKTMAPARA